MNKKLLSFIVLGALLPNAMSALAQPIPPQNIQVMNSIAVDATIRPHQSSFPDPIRSNLINHISDALDKQQPIKLFGEKKTFKSLSKINALTEPGLQLLKLELSTEQFTLGKLTLSGFEKAILYQNGQLVEGEAQQYSLSLPNGDHRLLILAEQVDDWKKVAIDWANDTLVADGKKGVTFHQDAPKHRLNAEQLFDSETVSRISLSPDGKHLIWSKRAYAPATKNESTTITELVDAKSLKVLYRWQRMTPGSIAFSADNRFIAYTVDNNVHLLDRSTFELTTIAKGLEGAGDFNWLNDDTLIFSWNRADESSHEITKRYRALEDRWTGWRNNSQLFLLDIHSGFIKQLTQSKRSTSLMDIDSKNNHLLFTREVVDYKQPAHGLSQLIDFDVTRQTEKLLGEYRTFHGAAFGKKGIYINAGPSFADHIGAMIDDNQVVNDYDSQLYLMDKKGNIEPLSKQFDPSINRFEVMSNGDLLLQVSDKDRRQLYVYSTRSGSYKKLDSKLDVVAHYSVSKQKTATVVYSGTSATSPQQVYVKKLNAKAKLLLDSANSEYANTRFGEIKDWDFTNTHNDVVDGRYYLPPNFDDSKKYPMITYYYGGTSPVSRAFTGRWPFSLWAAQGYVVYVMQPAGATGYGQKYSAKHVNAWGKQTADDIINSTKAFIKAHAFVDEKRVGNMGASYGGFMTMYLATKTDMFRASISHAGISNLSEYWGYGWWGYGYSGVASRGSFPWNNRELYVEQSPLFNADKITTPLLLLHGDADTNVPVTESHQMYTALKIQDKAVEFIEFANDDHHINKRDHRLRWWSTILSYFDKELKEQPLWWNTLYPKSE